MFFFLFKTFCIQLSDQERSLEKRHLIFYFSSHEGRFQSEYTYAKGVFLTKLLYKFLDCLLQVAGRFSHTYLLEKSRVTVFVVHSSETVRPIFIFIYVYLVGMMISCKI